MCYVIILDTIS